ncbi:IS630 transposase-related protein [Candidatus Tisiphia endosymbiont of Sialis lutaria]|uniref:IS630 transposase-related protein n=1 Tax=Candidatus Tisiphia endosymbiont of Sialis lutaria TaxID=2029164 RepID=UPI00312C8D01
MVQIREKMSTSPYSKDLRKKVISYIEKGNSQRAAAKIFDIHKNTISRWNVRKRKEGTILAKARVGLLRDKDKRGIINKKQSRFSNVIKSSNAGEFRRISK